MSLITGLKVDKSPIFSYLNGRIYLTNDFDRVKVWDGLSSAMRDAGIAAPAAAMLAPGTVASGNGTVGTHLLRFRYIDSTSPAGSYRSNASGTLSQVVTVSATDGKMTFSITDSGGGGKIIRSADPKVDTIQVEMTLASGTIFYVAITVANSATTVDVNISDTSLAVNDLAANFDINASGVDAGVGHEQPPLGAIITQVKDYAFIGGFHARTFTVGVTSGLTAVTVSGFSAQYGGRMLQVSGDTVAYEMSSATTTTITLKTAYAGSTNASITATVYPKAPNRIYWSGFTSPIRAQLPESWKAATRARDVLNGTGDTIRGMINWQGDLLISGQYSMDRLIFVDDPAVGELQSIPGKFGVWNHRCFVVVNQSLYGWGPNGAWVMRGGGPVWISQGIDTSTAASTGGYLDTTKKDQFHGYYEPNTKTIVWVFVKTGETVPRESITLELAQGRWTRAQFRQGIDASVNAADANGKYQAAVSDSTNGRTWYNTGATDGVPSASTGAYTIASSTSTSTMTVAQSLPSSTALGGNLSGVILYRPSTLEEKVISSNTSSTITLGSGFSTSLVVGESVYAGAIPWTLTTDWWQSDDNAAKKRPHFTLSFVPTTGGTLRVYIYTDFSASPMTFTVADNANWPNGVTKPSGSQTYVDVSMDPSTIPSGFVAIPMFSDLARSWRAVVQCLSPAGTLQLIDASFAVTSKRDQKRVTNE